MSEIEDELVATRKRIRLAKAEMEQAKVQLAEKRAALADIKSEMEQLLDELENPGERYSLFERPGNGNGTAPEPPSRGRKRR